MNMIWVIFQPRGADTERPKSGNNQASQQLPQSSRKNIPRGIIIFYGRWPSTPYYLILKQQNINFCFFLIKKSEVKWLYIPGLCSASPTWLLLGLCWANITQSRNWHFWPEMGSREVTFSPFVSFSNFEKKLWWWCRQAFTWAKIMPQVLWNTI